MATTTPNYGWSVPTSSDYVAQGAVAIETLGDSADATLFSVTGGKNVGLQHIGTYTASGSALTIDSIFSATYDNYKIVLSGTASAISNFRYQMRTTAPATDTSANYNYTSIRCNAGTGTVNAANGASQTLNVVTDLYTARNFSVTLELQNPFLAANTFVNGFSNYQANDDFYTHNASVKTTTVYGGIAFATSSGNFTSISAKVYGYRN
jgi:hypothetical protein